MATAILKPISVTESQRGFEKFWHVTYAIPINSSLSDVGLEEGDNYPADSNFEIIESSVKPRKNADGKSATKLATILAWKHDTE